MDVGLQAVASFLAGILGDAVKEKIKERIKAKSSQSIASIEAMRVYESLREVESVTGKFADLINEHLTLVHDDYINANNKNSDQIDVKRMEISLASDDVKISLTKLMITLNRIYPQLEVYEPDLVDDILKFNRSRSSAAVLARRGIGESQVDSNKVLLSVSEKVASNQQLINKVILDFKEFMRSSFSFKDLFER